MTEKMTNHDFQTKVYDVDEKKGIISCAVNQIGVLDVQGDMSMPGSFTKTLQENMSRMKWLYNHDMRQDIGVPIEGAEKDGFLVMRGQLYNTQLSKDVLNKYMVNMNLGHTLEHSIGVQAIKRDKADPRKVLEWKMFEYSTLSFLGACPGTHLIDVKSASPDEVKQTFDWLNEALKGRYDFTDERYKEFEDALKVLSKAFGEVNMVKCPYCGTEFDYNAQKEHTFSQEVMENAAMYARWIIEDTVYEHMESLKPEIQSEVLALLNAVKVNGVELTEKAVTDFVEYVRCPKCYTRVYKTTINDSVELVETKTEPSSGDTQVEVETKSEKEDDKGKAAGTSTLDFKSMSEKLFPTHSDEN